MIDGAKVGSKLCEPRACLFACFRKHNAQEKGRVRVLARPARVSLRVCTAMRLPTPGRNTRAYGRAHTCTSWAYTRAQLGALWACTIASGRKWAHTLRIWAHLGIQARYRGRTCTRPCPTAYATRLHSGTTTHALWAHSSRDRTHLGTTGGRRRESVCEWQFLSEIGVLGGVAQPPMRLPECPHERTWA